MCSSESSGFQRLEVGESKVLPRPGKLTYSTLILFRPIVLLNTVEKLIEKMISNCP